MFDLRATSRRTLIAGLATTGLSACAGTRTYNSLSVPVGWRSPSGSTIPYCTRIDGEGARQEAPPSSTSVTAASRGSGKPSQSTLSRIHRHIAEKGLVSAASDRPPRWPDRNRAPDYAHLDTHARDNDPVTLTPAVLQTLADTNGFPVARHGIVLFGLRGCVAVDPALAMAPSSTVAMKVAKPDHVTPQCSIGIWDKRNAARQTVAVFSASTVPSAFYMREEVQVLGLIAPGADAEEHYYRRANLLACGFYLYERGPHGKFEAKCIAPDWAGGDPPPGGRVEHAFRAQVGAGDDKPGRQDLVLRAVSKLEFDLDQVWDHCAAYDNMHPARTSAIAAWRVDPDTDRTLNRERATFSSAGCQVLAGDDPDGLPSDGWKTFRDRVYEAVPTGPFAYMLLTGDEAAIAASEGAHYNREPNQRIRVGSQNEHTTRLRAALRRTDTEAPLQARDAYAAMLAGQTGEIGIVHAPAFPVLRVEELARALERSGRSKATD